MDKMCKYCNKIKPVDCFNNQKKSIDGLSDWCRECTKIYRKARYDSNIEENRQITNKNRAERIAWHQDLKRNKPCLDCGKIYEPYCMDYDHVPSKGVKFENVSRLVLSNSPIKTILAEIEKCDLVCLLCHNIRTINRINQQNNKSHRSHIIRNIKIINSHKDKPCVICGIKYDNL